MIGLTIPVRCAECGGEVHLVNAGTVQAGTTATAIVGCVDCTTEFEVTAHLRRLGPNRAPAARRAGALTQ